MINLTPYLTLGMLTDITIIHGPVIISWIPKVNLYHKRYHSASYLKTLPTQDAELEILSYAVENNIGAEGYIFKNITCADLYTPPEHLSSDSSKKSLHTLSFLAPVLYANICHQEERKIILAQEQEIKMILAQEHALHNPQSLEALIE